MQRRGGVSRYFSELIDALRQLHDFHAELPRIFSDNEYLRERRTFLTAGHFKGKVRILRALNRIPAAWGLRGEFDVFHPTYYHPYFLGALRRPFVVTVHDMIHELFPGLVTDRKTALNKRLLCERASRIIAVSQNTRDDLCRLLGVHPDKVSVIHHGTTMTYNGFPRLTDRPYLLYVGGRAGYKNFRALLKAAQTILPRYDLHLVCAGGETLSREEFEAARMLGIEDRVQLFPSVSPSQLASLYHFSAVFCYPSLYEGFGLPLIEGFACGCPVAASRTSSIPEVAGDAAELFDPRSSDAIASALDRVLGSPSRSRELVQAGTTRVSSFTWRAAAEKTLRAYQDVL